MDDVATADYTSMLEQVKHRINNARYQALRSVNREMVRLYWDIGRIIIEKQQDEGYGKSLVEQLARDIQKEYPGIKGFSARSLWKMRNFYLHIIIKKNCHSSWQKSAGAIILSFLKSVKTTGRGNII